MNPDQLDAFTRAYLVCALWCTNDESRPDGGDPLDENYGIEDFAPEDITLAVKECADFRMAAGALLEAWSDEQAGHDLWLTRNGHGAGFWDRGWEHGRALSDLCGWRTAFPERDVEIGDDGKLYFFPS